MDLWIIGVLIIGIFVALCFPSSPDVAKARPRGASVPRLRRAAATVDFIPVQPNFLFSQFDRTVDGWPRPNTVGYRFCFDGQGDWKWLAGAAQFQGKGRPHPREKAFVKKQGLDGLACSSLAPERPFRLGFLFLSENP